MQRTKGLLLALLVGCAALPATLALGAGVLTRGIGNEPDSLDPHQASGTSAAIVLYDLFEGLVTVDAAGRLVGGCAESWSIDSDGRGMRFSLRAGLTWSDGTPLTATDFEYSFRRLLAPETAARYASFLYPLRNARAVSTGRAPGSALGVHALDARTLRLEFEQPAPQLLEVLSGISAAPVPRHVIERDGRDWTRPGRLVSNGAYRLTDVVPRVELRVERNERYRDATRVPLAAVRYIAIEDEGASLRRFQTGELQVAVKFPPDRLGTARGALGASLRRSDSFGSNMVLLNLRDQRLKDPGLRRALSLALDREALARHVLRGVGEPAHRLVPGAISDYGTVTAADAGLTLRQRTAQARALATTRVSSAEPLHLLYPADGKSKSLALAMLAMWRAAGTAVDIQSQDMTAVIAAVRGGRYQMALYAWYSSYDDASTFLDVLTDKGRASLTGYANAEFDRLFNAANGLLDPKARGAALAAAEAVALADHPLIPVYHSVNLRLVSPRVTGWIDNPRGANLSRYLDLRP